MESSAHQRLKLVAARLLMRGGCAAAAVEVRCPIARHRVDAAGYVDPLPRRLAKGGGSGGSWLETGELAEEGAARAVFGRGAAAKTVIVECKQSRADFLVDTRDVPALLEERARLTALRSSLEERIVKVCEPHLRVSGSSLFPEMDEWDLSASRVGSYRKVLLELRRVDERLHGKDGCKFWTLAHYRLADWLYLAAPRGVLSEREVPPGWGLIEVPREALEGPSREAVAAGVAAARVRVAAPERGGRAEHRARLLRNIAVAATRGWGGRTGGESGAEEGAQALVGG
jgi:hypothetical protein